MYQGKFSRKKNQIATEGAKDSLNPSMPPLELTEQEVTIDQISIDDILREMSGTPQEPQFAPAPKAVPAPAEPDAEQEEYEEAQEPTPEKGKVALLGVACALSAAILLLAAFLFVIRPLQLKMDQEIASEQESNYFSVFRQMFDQLDWASIYTLAGVEDTPFENRNSYAECMSELIGSRELQYALIPSASNVRCYCVMLGDTQLASFTLRLSDASQGGTNMTLESVQLLLPRTRTVTVEKPEGYSVVINGAILDDSYTLRSYTTLAEDYLPQGVSGQVWQQQTVTGLMLEPKVTILDRQGQSVVLMRDPDTGVYSPAPAGSVPDWEKNLLVSSATAFTRYVFGRTGAADIRNYFDQSRNAYEQVMNTGSPVTNVTSFQLDQNSAVVTDYYRYNDSVFSAQVSIRVAVFYNNGLSEDFFFTRSYLLERNAMGKYLVTELSQISFQQRRESVKLTFCHDDQVLSTLLIPIDSTTIAAPAAPEVAGRAFLGWARRTEGGSLHMVLTLDPTGAAVLTSGTSLEPMTLYAVYE